MDERLKQRQFEEQFLRQIRARAEVLTRGPIPAERVEARAMPDGANSVRDTLGRLGVYEPDVLAQMPGRQALQLTFDRPAWAGLLRRTVARARVQSLVDVEALARNAAPGPIDREAVLDALARYELLPTNQKPTMAIFASPTGFTPEARALVDAGGRPLLVLMGGRDDGGWDVAMPDVLRRTPWAALFELETLGEQLKRLQRYLADHPSELDSTGVSLTTLAAELSLPAERAEALVRQACRLDGRLMTVNADGAVHLCRNPLTNEGRTMGFWTKLFNTILRRKPTVAQRVLELTSQRVQLEQQRLEIDKTVDALEKQERDLLKQGAEAPSTAEKKQVAGKLMRLRRELGRHRTRAQMASQQIDIIGTQIHHMTLTEQTKKVALPSAEELTQQAAEAEQAMGQLATNADLAANIEVGATTPMDEEEEEAIFAEFAQMAQRETPSSAPAADSAAPTPPAAEKTPEKPDRAANPELG